ncbi:intraflagellar transport protein 74 homolog [Caerostris darwini]|uniref:Intraflagellar transport protein 74 homolog n=1 Tax=Caerostris darwini TaxID=1538125 RepID=A0AAV4R3J2_9ARAC|nr:intraflagellar transport protein 74 homolog [Caerostris darwini]
MEVNQFSSRTSRHVLSEPCPTEKSPRTKYFPSFKKGSTPSSEKGSKASNEFLHTPLFNKSLQDRRLSDQGLAVTRQKSRLENRQVRDKSYYMGLLYRKGYEVGSEIKKLIGKIELMKADQSVFVSYKHKAETQASELSNLQSTLSVYNLVDDMQNTGIGVDESVEKLQSIKADNQLESVQVEKMFELRKKKELQFRELETDASQEKYVVDILSSTTSPQFRDRYKNLKKMDEDLKCDLSKLEQELKNLKFKRKELEDKCVLLNKTKASSLIIKLNEEMTKRDNLFSEQVSRDTPSEMPSLQQRKHEHTDFLRCLGNQSRNIKQQIEQVQGQLENLNNKMHGIRNERSLKLKKLKIRENVIDAFSNTYPEQKEDLLNRLAEMRHKIRSLLEHMSSQLNFDRIGNHGLEIDSSSKEAELLSTEEQNARDSLKQELLDLMAKEALEDKLSEEIDKIKEEIVTKKREIDHFSNTEELKNQFEKKEKELLEESQDLLKQKEAFHMVIKDLQSRVGELEENLEKNGTYKELTQLEKQWHYLEQENFDTEEFLADAKVLGGYGSVKSNVMDRLRQLNDLLIEIHA